MMKHRFWIGTYSANGGEGLISATIDEAGRIEIEGAEPRIVDASYGLWCADLQTAWFVCEQEDGQVSGWLLEDERWVLLGSASTGGAAPCFLDISPDRSLLAVANYDSGSVAVIALDPVTGAPLRCSGVLQNSGNGPDPDRQAGPHIHCARFAEEGSTLYFTDLGLDRVFAASVGNGGEIHDKREMFCAPPGFGPRHLMALGNEILVNGELSSSLTALCKTEATFMPMDSLRTDPSNKPDNLGGHLLVEDQLVWTSNRGADTLVAFRVMQGALHQVACFASGGQSPRHFARVNKHLVVAHEKDGIVSSIDASAGNVLCDVVVPGAAFIMSA